MKTPLSHEQMTMIVERATRERNAALSDFIATFADKVLDATARGFEKFVNTLRVDARTGF